ncbi:hypothetical protein LB506_012729 [Fusarium annulatum]|nr:hypothetical protein LB506_012729 [Fusarium annulatum]
MAEHSRQKCLTITIRLALKFYISDDDVRIRVCSRIKEHLHAIEAVLAHCCQQERSTICADKNIWGSYTYDVLDLVVLVEPGIENRRVSLELWGQHLDVEVKALQLRNLLSSKRGVKG